MCDDIMIFMIQVLQATFQSGVSPSQKACGESTWHHDPILHVVEPLNPPDCLTATKHEESAFTRHRPSKRH